MNSVTEIRIEKYRCLSEEYTWVWRKINTSKSNKTIQSGFRQHILLETKKCDRIDKTRKTARFSVVVVFWPVTELKYEVFVRLETLWHWLNLGLFLKTNLDWPFLVCLFKSLEHVYWVFVLWNERRSLSLCHWYYFVRFYINAMSLTVFLFCYSQT